MPRAGRNALPPVSALIAERDWDVPEVHLESGRLDEVFRTLTRPTAAAAAVLKQAPGADAGGA